MKRITHNHIVPILAIMVVLGTFTFDFCIFFMKGKLSDNSVLTVVVGSLNTSMTMVLGYYFTANYSNREKTSNTTGTKETTTTSVQNETTGAQ